MQYQRRNLYGFCPNELFLIKVININTCLFVYGDAIAYTLFFYVW